MGLPTLVDSRRGAPRTGCLGDEPAYHAARGTFAERGSFILRKLSEHDPIRFKEVMDDLYRDEPPDPVDITKFLWQTILAYIGASEEEIKDVQARMARVWR